MPIDWFRVYIEPGPLIFFTFLNFLPLYEPFISFSLFIFLSLNVNSFLSLIELFYYLSSGIWKPLFLSLLIWLNFRSAISAVLITVYYNNSWLSSETCQISVLLNQVPDLF